MTTAPDPDDNLAGPTAPGGESQAMGSQPDGRVAVRAATLAEDDEEHADTELAALAARVADLEAKLAEREAALAASEMRRSLESALAAAGAVDVEAAALLTLASVEGEDDPDVQEAVERLRVSRPYLFGGSGQGAPAGSAMAPGTGGPASMTSAALEAAATGDRNALLRYLRMRRSAV